MRIACGLAALALVAACAPKSLVVLAPDPDGKVGRITVANDAGAVEIDRAHQATLVRSREAAPAAPTDMDPAAVDRLFGAVVARQAAPSIHFRLHFESDSAALLPESRRLLPEIADAVRQRAPTYISVVGHTDTAGDKAYNVALSLRRAQAVKQLLVGQGVDAAAIDVSSHGEENLLVPTGDQVSNAQNRRVEVVVR
jgi:outer membrane protein OmpA-like peptidoglycan-associated protein